MTELRDWRPGLVHLKLQLEIHNSRRARFDGADPNLFWLTGLVMIGWMERRPYNLTSLAHDLGISRATATRGVEDYARHGWVTIEQRGRSSYLHPTEKLIERTTEAFLDNALDHLRRAAEVYKIMRADPLR